MIKLTKISIEGFCSIPSLELDLNTPGITVIRGANGFGKSTIFSAITWVIYGKNIKGVSNVNTWKKFRTSDYRGTKVELYYQSSKDQRIRKITRCSEYQGKVDGAKGSSRLILQMDTEQVKEKSKPQIQKAIETDIGISYRVFINSAMFGQGMKRLIQETNADKKSIFESIFDLAYLSKAYDIAKERYDSARSSYESSKSRVLSLESKARVYKEQISELRESIKKQDSDNRNKVKALSEKREKYQAIIDGIEVEDIDALCQARDKVKTKISKSNEKLNAARESTGIPLEELIDKIIKLLRKGKVDSSLSLLLTLKDAFQVESSETDKIRELEKKLSSIVSKISIAKSQKSQIERYSGLIKDIEAEEVNLIMDKPDTAGSRAMLKKAKSSLKDVHEQIGEINLDSYQKMVDLYKWAMNEPFGNRGIRSYLIESSLGYLNKTLETYGDILGFNIHFGVDLESKTKEFVTLISMGGVDVEYDELSGGQKQLVNLSLALSMNNLVSQSSGLNITFLDEIFESLSDDNIEIVIGLIKKAFKDKTLFLITHQKNLPIPNSRVLNVTYSNGLSHYEF